MNSWNRWHGFIKLVSILFFIENVLSTRENSSLENSPLENLPLEDSSMSLKIPLSTNFTNELSTSTKQDETTWNPQDLFSTEETTILPTTTTVNDDLTTEKSNVDENNIKINDEETLTQNIYGKDEKNLISKFVGPNFLDPVDADVDNNVIDTFGDETIRPLGHHKRVLVEDPPVPEPEECQAVETSSESYINNPWNNPESMNKNVNDNSDSSQLPNVPDDSIRVEELILVGTTPDSLSISWKNPNNTANVTYYLVKWGLFSTKQDNSCRVTTIKDSYSIKITSLNACSKYDVIVKPYTKTENGTIENGMDRSVTGTTGLDVHKDSLNLKIANATTDSLKISWSMPGTDCVDHYQVGVCAPNAVCTEITTKETTYTKKDLLPCLNYKFNLTVYGDEMESRGSLNITGRTAFLEPGIPSPAKTTSGNRTVSVWWPQSPGHTCVKHYSVTWIRSGGSAETNETNETGMNLTNLETCAKYDIDIIAVFVLPNGTEGKTKPEMIQSEMTAPAVTDAPIQLQKPTVDETQITINWLIRTNKSNNCNPILLKVECNAEKILGEGYPPKSGKIEYNLHSGLKNTTKNTTVYDLSPYTSYSCHSLTINTGGQGEMSLPIYVNTLQAVPSAPELFPIQGNVTNTSIVLEWKKPTYLPGILTNISIKIIWEYRFYRPSWCKILVETEHITSVSGNATSYIYDVKPYSSYNITILASTMAGWGNVSEAVQFNTTAKAALEVTEFRHTMQENAFDPNILDVTVKWGIPCYINAPGIKYFYILGSGQRYGFPEHKFGHTVDYSKRSCINDNCSLTLDNLREEHHYVIQIATKVEDYVALGDMSELTFTFPAGVPPPPDENYTRLISIDPFKARRTTTTATVLLPIFPDVGGAIRCYAIIVSKLGFNNGTLGRFKDNSSWPYTAPWSESMQNDFEIPYQAVKFCTGSYPTYVEDYGRLKAVKFVLGEDTETCVELSSNRDERSYCNGPLKPDTWYHVRMRAFTDGGYRDSVVFTVKTNAELQVAIVIGTIFGILFLGILTTMMLLVRKCSLQAVLRRFLHSDMPGSPVPTPFTRRKFIAHCQQLVDNPGKLSNEYQLLQTLSVDLQMPTNAACLQANRKKNRYTDILPYDFSRVKLEVIDNDPNTDYINASFIKGFTGEEDYIACQGPKEETTYDFWRMIDQYDVKIIVMLTQLVEKNKEKCHQYFPTIRETFTYENVAIRCTMELDYRTYTQRTLILQKENEKRSIIHLHFKDWPDHDVPEDFDPMINFCQIMRRHMESNRGLVVVHCSAGIGRTGTLIALDILLQHIKENRKLDVFGTVYRLRHHRINMVQRESQYAYIYNCIKQVLKNPYFSKTYKPPSVDPIFDGKKKEASDSRTNLVSSLETLKKSSFSTSEESAEPTSQTSTKSRTSYLFNGLRCAKSTSAIDTRPYLQLMGRSNTHGHPISDIVNDPNELKSSDISFDMTDSEGSTTSLYENMQPLSRSKSAHAVGRNDDLCVTQILLEHDTSL